MDSSEAGKLISEQLEAIEKEYGDSEDHEIGVVITLVEVVGEGRSELRLRTNLGGQPYRLVGYLEVAKTQAIGAQFGGGEAEAD